MGGVPPLGYRAQDRKLVVVDGEAEIVRSIFRRYAGLGSVRLLKDELEAQGVKSKSDERLGWQAIRARRALPDVAEPASIEARSFTRNNPILANTRRSSISRCGMRFRRSLPAMPPSTTRAHGRVSRACSPACCLTATATG
jgi:hypothetical protein